MLPTTLPTVGLGQIPGTALSHGLQGWACQAPVTPTCFQEDFGDDGGCGIPVACPCVPCIPGGVCKAGGTSVGAHGCFCCHGGMMAWGQTQLRSITGGREEGVGTVRSWHTLRPLMQELGH